MSSAKLSFLNECRVSKLRFLFSHSCFPTEPSPKTHPLKNDDLCADVHVYMRLRDLCPTVYSVHEVKNKLQELVGSVLHVGPEVKLIYVIILVARDLTF